MPDPDDLAEDAAVLPTDAEPPALDDDEGLELDPEMPAEVVAAILESATPPVVQEVESEPIDQSTTVEPDADLHQAIGRLGDRIDQRLAGLQAQFDREVRAEAGRERVVDRLHAELQEYKQDLLLKVQRPIFVDLIQLHDDVGKMAEAQPQEGDGYAARSMLESIQTAVEDILYRQGVEPFRNEAQAFDPRRQRTVTTTPTEDPALAKTVSQRLRPGFQAGDKIIRPEIVTVYTFRIEPRSGE